MKIILILFFSIFLFFSTIAQSVDKKTVEQVGDFLFIALDKKLHLLVEFTN
jgi:hypothetical protein